MLATMDNTKFSDWLVEEIKNRGWTQSELSRRARVNRQVISSYINARRDAPDERILIQIAGALNLPPESVFRAAGLLPPVSKDAADLEEWREILSYLTDAEKEELKRIGWLKIDLRRQAELRKEMQDKRKRKQE